MEKDLPKLTLKGSSEKKWYPIPMSTLRTHLDVFIVKGTSFHDNKVAPLINNVAYNIQYIEFLDRLIKDVNLSDVLVKQNIKSFVVHSGAVIEAIFHYLVVSTGNATESEWASCNKQTSNKYKINGTDFLIKTEILTKSDPPILTEMTFNQLSRKVEDKKLLGDVGDLYKEISRIRKLRNKIHLHIIESLSDTDYNSFGKSEYELTRRVLFGVLTSPLFSTSPYNKFFDFLKNG